MIHNYSKKQENRWYAEERVELFSANLYTSVRYDG
jgi:hypothetical protein